MPEDRLLPYVRECVCLCMHSLGDLVTTCHVRLPSDTLCNVSVFFITLKIYSVYIFNEHCLFLSTNARLFKSFFAINIKNLYQKDLITGDTNQYVII